MKLLLAEFFSRQPNGKGQGLPPAPSSTAQAGLADGIFASLDRAKENFERARNYFSSERKREMQEGEARAEANTAMGTTEGVLSSTASASCAFVKAFAPATNKTRVLPDSKQSHLRSQAQQFLAQVRRPKHGDTALMGR